MKLLASSILVLSVLAGASILDSARADPNPYLPSPAASTETADHGTAAYCTVKPLGDIWTCAQELAITNNGEKLNGGHGTGLPSRARHDNPTPPTPKCDHETPKA